MSKEIKRTLIFSIVYFVFNVLTILLLFAWTSFGGRESMNLFQKIITVFFSFPGLELGLNQSNFFLYLLVNTIFWSTVFYVVLVLIKKIRNQKKIQAH
ncbi:MAG: hypothetical protein AAF843_17720 [Bacteroidota bacterium]